MNITLEEKIEKLKHRFSKNQENDLENINVKLEEEENKKNNNKISGKEINKNIENQKPHIEDNVNDNDNDFLDKILKKLFDSDAFKFIKDILNKKDVELNKENENSFPQNMMNVPNYKLINEANKMEALSEDGTIKPNNAKRTIEQQEREKDLIKLDELNEKTADNTLTNEKGINEKTLGTIDPQKQKSIDTLDTLN